MGFFKRLFGICRTSLPEDAGCWTVDGDTIRVELNRAPELNDSGGAIRLEGEALEQRVLLFRGDDGELHALPNACTHAKRRLDPIAGSSTVECCSVGKSTFDYKGGLISGSAKESLTPLNVEVDADVALVKLNAS